MWRLHINEMHFKFSSLPIRIKVCLSARVSNRVSRKEIVAFPPPPPFYCYEMATISRLHKNTGLFWKRALQKRPIFWKGTYILMTPTNYSHPICEDSILMSCILVYLHFQSGSRSARESNRVPVKEILTFLPPSIVIAMRIFPYRWAAFQVIFTSNQKQPRTPK